MTTTPAQAIAEVVGDEVDVEHDRPCLTLEILACLDAHGFKIVRKDGA